jgi:hypothetical protein
VPLTWAGSTALSRVVGPKISVKAAARKKSAFRHMHSGHPLSLKLKTLCKRTAGDV